MHYPTDDKVIQAVIVDDERLAVKGMEMLLADYPDIHVTGTADSVDSAAELIRHKQPDLIFLDIQLQGETGFDLFDRMAVDSKVIFVTAFDEYAIRAFEVNALDYLLKPVSHERFKDAVSRLFGQDEGLVKKGQPYALNDMVSLNTGRSIKFVKANEIVCIHAAGDYAKVSIIDGTHELVYRTLKDWEKSLPSESFFRVHRSAIVNMAHIDRVEPTTSNRLAIYLHHATSPIIMSQRYTAQFRKAYRNTSHPCMPFVQQK